MKTSTFTFFLALSALLFVNDNLSAQYRQVNATEDAKKNGYSDLWGENGENWNPGGRLPDVSFCGYDMGDSEIPSYPVRATLGQNGSKPNDGKNDATELQNLINGLQTPGTIKIPKGVWNIDKRINITKSGVVLVGEDGTEFRMNKTLRQVDNNPSDNRYAFNDAFIRITGNIKLNAQKKIVSNANHGSDKVILENGVSYSPGTWVDIIQNDDGAESLFKYVNGTSEKRSFWDDNGKRANDPILSQKKLFQFKAKVVKQEGNVLTLNRTLPLDIKTKWSPRISSINMGTTLTNCGIENIRFRMNGQPFKGHFTMDGSSVLYIRFTINCWVKNIECIDIDNGINLQHSYNGTYENIVLRNDKRGTTDRTGHHGLWASQRSSDNLFSNATVSLKFIHDLSVEQSANGNVFSQCSGNDLNFDHHRGSPYSNVFTEIHLGAGTRMYTSSGSGYRGTHTGIYTTVWNITKNSGSFGNLPSVTGGTVPGGGVSKDWYFLNSIGVKGARIGNVMQNRNQYVEFSNSEVLKTPNIYLAQRNKRLNIIGRIGPGGYSYSTDEMGTISISDIPYDIAYGQDGSYVFLTNQTQNVTCDNVSFGSDPLPGVQKYCFIKESKAPYLGTPVQVPGIIEAENYDFGGQGVSYNDTDQENKGASESNFRVNQGVDIGAGSTIGNAIGWTADGEWVEYTIDVQKTQSYNLVVGFSSDIGDGTLSAELVGEGELFSDLAITNTGGWDVYETKMVEALQLEKGQHFLRFNIGNGRYNLDRFEFTPSVISSVSEELVEELEVFPNPSEDGIFHLSSSVEWVAISSKGVSVKSGDSDRVDLSNEAEGVYLLKTQKETFKIIIE